MRKVRITGIEGEGLTGEIILDLDGRLIVRTSHQLRFLRELNEHLTSEINRVTSELCDKCGEPCCICEEPEEDEDDEPPKPLCIEDRIGKLEEGLEKIFCMWQQREDDEWHRAVEASERY